MALWSNTLPTLLVLSLLGAAPAMAQAPASGQATTPTGSRNPVQGDPGAKPSPQRRPTARAVARADKQPPGTENGNQPDRASAGGGGR